MSIPERIRVEVVYARPDQQALETIELEFGATLREAIERSGLLQRFPEIDLDANRVGRWNRAAELGDALRDGDRVEIYRPLLVDPKEMRRKRASLRRKQR